MRDKMYLVNSMFGAGTGPNLIREEVLVADWLKCLQENNQPVVRNEINQNVSILRQ